MSARGFAAAMIALGDLDRAGIVEVDAPAEVIRFDVAAPGLTGLSGGERVMYDLAHDLYGGGRRARVGELLDLLDDENYERALRALRARRG